MESISLMPYIVWILNFSNVSLFTSSLHVMGTITFPWWNNFYHTFFFFFIILFTLRLSSHFFEISLLRFCDSLWLLAYNVIWLCRLVIGTYCFLLTSINIAFFYILLWVICLLHRCLYFFFVRLFFSFCFFPLFLTSESL